jgi:mRNA interferase MazF
MYKQGDILLIPVPFSNLSITKQRPVLVLSNDKYNQLTEDLLVAAITSQLRDIDYSVLIAQEDLAEGNLKVTSAIRADKIYTLSKEIIIKKFGSVKKEVVQSVVRKLNNLIIPQ